MGDNGGGKLPRKEIPMTDSKEPRRRNWLDEWKADLTARTEALGPNALDYTDSPEDVERKANGQASVMAQEWADWRHDGITDMIEAAEKRQGARVDPKPAARFIPGEDPGEAAIRSGLAAVRYEGVFGRRPDSEAPDSR
jgi:hypothetical protein